jgi:hypothetical protein
MGASLLGLYLLIIRCLSRISCGGEISIGVLRSSLLVKAQLKCATYLAAAKGFVRNIRNAIKRKYGTRTAAPG